MDGFDFSWASDNGSEYYLALTPQTNFSGTYRRRRLGGAPMLRREQNGRIWGSSLSIKAECMVDSEFTDLYASDNFAWKAQLFLVYNAEYQLLWSGHVTAESYAEPDIATPYDVDIIATDGLGLLKCYTVADLSDQEGSLLSHLSRIAEVAHISGDVYQMLPGRTDTLTNEQLLAGIALNLSSGPDEILYDALEDILTTLHANVFTYMDGLFVVDENAIDPESLTQVVWDATLEENLEIGSLMVTTSMYPVGSLFTEVVAAHRNVTVVSNYEPKDSMLLNPDMETDTGWVKGGDAYHSSAARAFAVHAAQTWYTSFIQQARSFPHRGLHRDLRLTVEAGIQDGVAKRLVITVIGEVTNPVSTYYGNIYRVETDIARAPRQASPSGAGYLWHLGGFPSASDTRSSYLPCFNLESGTRNTPAELSILLPLGYNQRANGRRMPYSSAAGFQDIDKITALIMPDYHDTANGFINVYSVRLTESEPMRGFKERLTITAGALTPGDDVAVLPVSAAGLDLTLAHASSFDKFLHAAGSGADLSNWVDGATACDHLGFIARQYARSCAVPRIRISGVLNVPKDVDGFCPFIVKDDAVYLVQTSEWNLLVDNLNVDMLSVPNVTLSTGVTVKIEEL